MYQLIDFLNPQGTIALTDKIDKINYNLSQVEPLKQNIELQKASNKNSVTCMTVLGRWIIVYKSNLLNDADTIMYFIDFRTDTESFIKNDVFSKDTILGIEKIQNQYDIVFNEKLDTVQLSFAEPFEKILQPNLFICDNDEIVIETAKRLGAFPIIEKLKNGDKIKVVLIDDKIILEGITFTNIYALIHFGGHDENQKNDNGFAYIKLFDLPNNLDKIDDFQKAIEGTGGKFERGFFMDRFTTDRLN